MLQLGHSIAVKVMAQSLTGIFSVNLNYISSRSNIDNGAPAQEVLEESKYFNRNWNMDHFCDILAKTMTAFYTCAKNFALWTLSLESYAKINFLA